VTGVSGKKDLYLVFKGSGEPFRFNWFKFSKSTGVKVKAGSSGNGRRRAKPEKQMNMGKIPEENAAALVDLSGRSIAIDRNPAPHRGRQPAGITIFRQREISR
jgi:hypothetical protein